MNHLKYINILKTRMAAHTSGQSMQVLHWYQDQDCPSTITNEIIKCTFRDLYGVRKDSERSLSEFSKLLLFGSLESTEVNYL